MTTLTAEAIRGTMRVSLNELGQVTLDQRLDDGIKHVFTASLIGHKLVVHDHLVIAPWQTVWDEYIGQPESRKALGLLTGGALPGQLYAIEVQLQNMRLMIPKNGSYLDGPFALTTNPVIHTKEDLEAALRALGPLDMNLVLQSSFIRQLTL
jgi:hypothetical protein